MGLELLLCSNKFQVLSQAQAVFIVYLLEDFGAA